MTIRYPDINTKEELYDAIHQLEETGFPRIYNEKLREEYDRLMPKIDTTEVKEFLMENLSEQVADNIYYYSVTGCWIFVENNQPVAFEDADANYLYIFDTVEYLRKFVQDNSWTYDVIVDFESGSTCYYVEDQNDEHTITSHMEIGNLDQTDVEYFMHRLFYLRENW